MHDTARTSMTVEEFFVWQQRQEERYELVDGVPVIMRDPITMMTGASSQHDRITGNVLASLHAQLRGSRCWPATADLAIRTRIRSLRRADVLVARDESRLDHHVAQEPKMVVVIFSPSDWGGLAEQRKIEEYRQHSGLAYLLLIESEQAQATLITREGEKWSPSDFDGLDATIELPAIGCRLVMADVYAGVTFASQPEVAP